MFTLVEIFSDSAMYLDLLRLGYLDSQTFTFITIHINYLSFRIQNLRTFKETGAILNRIHAAACTVNSRLADT